MQGVDFIPISVATLLPTETVGLDLYQQEIDSERLVLYRGAEFPLSMDDLEQVARSWNPSSVHLKDLKGALPKVPSQDRHLGQSEFDPAFGSRGSLERSCARCPGVSILTRQRRSNGSRGRKARYACGGHCHKR